MKILAIGSLSVIFTSSTSLLSKNSSAFFIHCFFAIQFPLMQDLLNAQRLHFQATAICFLQNFKHIFFINKKIILNTTNIYFNFAQCSLFFLVIAAISNTTVPEPRTIHTIATRIFLNVYLLFADIFVIKSYSIKFFLLVLQADQYLLLLL